MKTNLSIAYIDFGDRFDPNGTSGIERKKLSQIFELEKLGEVKRFAFSPKRKKSLLGNVSRTLPFFPSTFFFTYDEKQFAGLDVVYFRKPAYIDRYTIKLLKDIKKQSPKCLILFEIPTYPYDKEKTGLGKYPLLEKDRWNRRKLQKYVDRIVLVTSKERNIFNIPTICTMNGIDFENTLLREVSPIEQKSIHAIIIANFEFWHGLDRIIGGLIQYYSAWNEEKPKFTLHIVGDGPGIEKIKQQCKENGIEKYVLLHGSLSFTEITKVYNQVSLAINSIGRHRITGTRIDSSIKSREYAAKGLPIITEKGISIDYVPENYPYVLEIPADESLLDIESVIAFHDRIYTGNDPVVIADNIRTFAKDRCSSEAMMQPVLTYAREILSK
jgi:hypothetical protein